MNHWRNTLAAAALLLGLQLHAAGQAIVEITSFQWNTIVTDGIAQLRWYYYAQNFANVVTNWNEHMIQVKLYDIYSVTPPTQFEQQESFWSMHVYPGSASNYWDVTFSADEWIGYIDPDGSGANFNVATYVPTNALNRLVVGTRRGQGGLETHGWQPAGPLENRIAGDGFVGPVGLAEEVRPVVVGLDLVGATAVVAVSNTLAGALYEMQTATNGLAGGWSVLTNIVPSGSTLTLTGAVHNPQQQFWRVRGPL